MFLLLQFCQTVRYAVVADERQLVLKYRDGSVCPEA